MSYPAVYRAAAKADAILPATIIVALTKIACIGAATTPVPYMQLASAMSAAEESDQKTLARRIAAIDSSPSEFTELRRIIRRFSSYVAQSI